MRKKMQNSIERVYLFMGCDEILCKKFIYMKYFVYLCNDFVNRQGYCLFKMQEKVSF